MVWARMNGDGKYSLLLCSSGFDGDENKEMFRIWKLDFSKRTNNGIGIRTDVLNT